VRALSICPDSVMVDTGSIGTKGAVWCSLTSLSSDQNSLLSAIANRYLPPAALAPSPPASCELYAVGGVLVRAVSGQSASALAEGPEGDERVEMSAGLRRMIGDLRAGEEGERPISASLAVHAMQCLLVPKVSSIVARQPPRSRAKLSVDPTRLELLMPRKRRVLWAAVACVLSLSWLSLAAALFSAFSAWSVLLASSAGFFGGWLFAPTAVCGAFFVLPTMLFLSILFRLTRAAMHHATLQQRLTVDGSEYRLTSHAAVSPPQTVLHGDVWRLLWRKGGASHQQSAVSLSHLLEHLCFMSEVHTALSVLKGVRNCLVLVGWLRVRRS